MTLEDFRTVTKLEGCTEEEVKLAHKALSGVSDKDRLVAALLRAEKKASLAVHEKADLANLSADEYKSLLKVINIMGYGHQGSIPLLDFDKPKVKALFNAGLVSVHKMAGMFRCTPISILNYLDLEGCMVKRGNTYQCTWYPLNLYRLMTGSNKVHEISRSMGSKITSTINMLPAQYKDILYRYFKDLMPYEDLTKEDKRLLDKGVSYVRRALGLSPDLLRFESDEAKVQYDRYQKLAKESAISVVQFQELRYLSIERVNLPQDTVAALKAGGVKYIMDKDLIKNCNLTRRQKAELTTVARKYGLVR